MGMVSGRDRKIKQRTIPGVFLQYVCVLGAGALLWILFLLVLLLVLVETGKVLPADYAERQLRENAANLQSAPEITEEMIPAGCTYGVYGRDGEWLYGTFPVRKRTDVWEHYETKNNYDAGTFYCFMERGMGEVCIVNYSFSARFRGTLLGKYLPSVEVLLPVVYVILFLLHTVVVSRRFGKYMRDRLEVLNEVTGEIRKQNLEFEKKHSELKEVDGVLDSLYQMKEALSESLFRQWDLEKSKEEQIAALAHDIKTPLTVVRGNAELLAEGELEEEEKEYNRDILRSVSVMEEYLALLNEILLDEGKNMEEESASRVAESVGTAEEMIAAHDENEGKETVCAGNAPKAGEQEVSCEELAGRLEEQARLLASARQCPVLFSREELRGEILCDQSQIVRAFQNIVSNALDYSPSGKKIQVTFSARMEMGSKYLAVTVMDEGTGFSAEDLKHATERFYRSDKSRSSKIHYGIGLHTAEEFVKAQGGYLTVANGENCGGKVTLSIRIMEKI